MTNETSDPATPNTVTPDEKANQKTVVQADDPIIIKGGSILLKFDKHNFEDLTAAGDDNRSFSHVFGPRLNALKIFRAGAIFYQTALNATDVVMVCYDGSRCPEVPPA
jgi:hypothetical protein